MLHESGGHQLVDIRVSRKEPDNDVDELKMLSMFIVKVLEDYKHQ